MSGTGGNGGAPGNGTVSGLEVSSLISGLDKPWDIAWLPNETVLITERPGRLNVYGNGIGQAPSLVIEPTDLVASGEGGMLGLEVDPDFDSNGYVYVCFCSDAGGVNPEYVPDVRLVRYELTTPNGDSVVMDGRTDIVTDMPYTSGRHSGCRPRFGPDGYLWVGTGDAAYGGDPTAPQDDNSFGGKVLRIDRDGNAAPGNVDGLWFSKGHRNIQGMAFRAGNDPLGMSAEHGPDTDDEINLLVQGNFGWDPGLGYNESVPMTDTDKFPDAIEAAFSTGRPTLAYSGAEFIEGDQWGNWDGVLAVATLKAEHLHIYFVDAEGNVTDGGRFIEDEGRLRSPRMGPDGLLYVTTDGGGSSGEVLRVSPVFD
ncbi:MAG: PQQ-dependent sugar dehydrogenase [Myxococcales bacterium]|nr:PQQ-dependent sugar dehydrogenase [Myxococcales bacterium]